MELLLSTREKLTIASRAVFWQPKGSIIMAHRDEDIHREWVRKVGIQMSPEKRGEYPDWPYAPYVLPLWKADFYHIAQSMRRNEIHPEDAWDAITGAEPLLIANLPTDPSGVHVTDLWPFTFRERQMGLCVRFDDDSRLPLHQGQQNGIYRRVVMGVPVPATSRPVFGRLYRINYWSNKTLSLDEQQIARAENDVLATDPIRTVVLGEDDLAGNVYQGNGAASFDPFEALGLRRPNGGVSGGPGQGGRQGGR